jgi:hypothetical protein
MIEIRILKPEEYHLLNGTPGEAFLPENTWIAAALTDGDCIGHLVALSLPHIEGAWIKEGYRGGTMGYRLHSAVTDKLKELGASCAIAFAVNTKMESYLSRLGYKQFATAWRKDI